MQLISPLVGLILASFVPAVYSQLPPEEAAIALIGTWSSGSRNVLTGPNFANPRNMTFNYPPTTGISFSFTDTHYEAARYRFNSNGSEPQCIQGIIGWSHGNYTRNDNGSMTLFPFADGYQQVQDPCAAVSENFIENYMITQEMYTRWSIFNDLTQGPKLHLFQFDGAPLAPMFQVSPEPNMHPTQLLRNVTTPNPDAGAAVQRRSEPSSAVSNGWSAGMTSASGAVILALASLVL